MQNKIKKDKVQIEEIKTKAPSETKITLTESHSQDYTICKAFYDNAHDDGFHQWRIASLPTQLLRVDDTYQRDLDMGHVREIYAGWKPDKCEPLEVNLREDGGGFFVMDGTHRLKVAELLGLKMVPCRIYLGLTQEEEADFFACQGDGRREPTSYNKFKARCAAGDEVAISVKKMCEKYRVSYVRGRRSAFPTLGGMSTIMKTCSKYGEEGVAWVFEAIQQLTWYGDRKAYCAAMIQALSNIYGTHENKNRAMSDLLHVLNGRIHKPEDIIAKAITERPGRGLTQALTQYFEECIVCK